MRASKLFQLLHSIPDDERKQFALYVASPYFNAVPRLGKLLEVLETHLLRYKTRELSEAQTFALLLPNQPFDQNRLRKDCSSLVKLLQNFLAQQQFQQAIHRQSQFLVQRVNREGLDQFLPQYYAQAILELEGSEAPAAERSEAEAELGIERYRYDLRQPHRGSDVDLNLLIARLEHAHAIRKMELCYLQLNHRFVTGKGPVRQDISFVQAIGEQIDLLPPRTQMYYHLYCCTLDPAAEGNFETFRNLLDAAALEAESLEGMYTAAINYCARRSNAGHSQYLRKNLEIYQTMLQRNILGPDRRVMSAHFKNIVVLASRLKEFEWARQFVATYQHHLQGEFNRNAENFGLGYIAFMEGEFSKAEPLLYRVLDDYEDINYGVDARVALLRIYYETENTIGLDSLADSFRMFIKRNTGLSGHRKANLQAFIRYLRRLAHIPQFDQLARQKLHEDIRTGRKIAQTEWLLEKLKP